MMDTSISKLYCGKILTTKKIQHQVSIFIVSIIRITQK